MKTLTILLSLLFPVFLFAQGTETIRVRREAHPDIYFCEIGSDTTKVQTLARCICSDTGKVEFFQFMVTTEDGKSYLIDQEGDCISRKNFRTLMHLREDEEIEFLNVRGRNKAGEEIRYAGMRFVILPKR